MNINIDLEALKTALPAYLNELKEALKTGLPVYLNELKKFRFSIQNPLFWVILFILFLILLRFWVLKKAFLFCSVLAIILLAMPKLESVIASKLASMGGTFDPLAFRIPCFLFISFLFIYFAFFKR